MRVFKMIQNCNGDQEEIDRLRNFANWLLSVGEGTVQMVQNNIISLNPDMICESPTEMINAVYSNYEQEFQSPNYFKKRAILAASNKVVDQINSEMLDNTPGEERVFRSVDTVVDPDAGAIYSTEYLNMINLSGLPQHKLKLKVNSVIVLIRNLDVKHGHCNGTRYIIQHLSNRLITARKLHVTDDSDDMVLIPRIPNFTKENEFPFILKRLQFPVRLAFGMTFNRAQGQSIEICGILLSSSVWTHGQLYVALSRCGDPRNVHIYANQEEFNRIGLDPSIRYARNVVYTELFN